MSKIALYRKYRPHCFAQVLAQDFVVKTLKHEIINNNLYHAYIFSGTRGSGKTSVARIFARTLNCLSPNDGDCCNKCKNCLITLQNNLTDIYEIDAASNSGVDEIRKLIETVNYLPTQLSKKVYIIDEAHMLSNSAWNALLKTIEEPPTHVCFIFATTEVNKIPMTIISRCQRFDFYQLNLDTLIQLITDVCNKENILIANDAKIKIAQLSDGSARDCLSILDQINNYSNGEITIDHINKVFGLLSLDFKLNFINNIFDNQKLESLLNQISSMTSNYLNLAKDLIDLVIDKIIYEKTHNFNLLKYLSLSDVQKINLSLELLYKLLELFNKVYEKIKLFGNGEFYFKNLVLTNLITNDSIVSSEIQDKTPTKSTINQLSAFTTKTVTNEYTKTTVVPNNEIVRNNDYKNLFNQIISNEDNELKNNLNNKLNELKTNYQLDDKLPSLTDCIKVLVSSKHGAVLLFEYKNQAKAFNDWFWTIDGYKQIKENLFDNSSQDYVLIASDKNTIKNWRDDYLKNPKKYEDINLDILEQLKTISDDEKYKRILDIIGEGDK